MSIKNCYQLEIFYNMSDEGKKKKKSKLWKSFKKVAKIGLVTAFSFAVLGGLDFIFFHELAEGAAFLDATRPIFEGALTGDLPIVNASIADGLLSAAEFIGGFTAPPVSEASAFAEAYTPLIESQF